jgi:hypothetical protein
MPCPTCDGTMQAISTGERHYWCPRCGTLKEQGTHYDNVSAPALVGRCRRYRSGAGLTPEQRSLWHAVGLDESIDVPADRPPPEG